MTTADASTTNRGTQDRARVPLPLRLAGRARRAAGLLALALLPAAPAQAQSVNVSNLSQADNGYVSVIFNSTYYAQAFTTGGTSTDSYTLNSVVLNFRNHGSGQLAVSVHANSSGSPGSKIGSDLTGTIGASGGNTTYSTSQMNTITLTGGTTYFVQVRRTGTADRRLTYTDSNSESGTTGWSIVDVLQFSNNSGSSWEARGDGRAVRFTVNATTVSTAISLTAGSITHNSATLTLANNSAAWYYKSTVSGASCSSMQASTVTMLNLSSLSANTAYTYKAYSDSACSTANEIASVTFTTDPAAPTLSTAATANVRYTAGVARNRPSGSSPWNESWNFKSGTNLQGNLSGAITGRCATGTTLEVGWYQSTALTTGWVPSLLLLPPSTISVTPRPRPGSTGRWPTARGARGRPRSTRRRRT